MPKAKWTILTYIAAHNNLDALGQRSLAQIVNTGNTPEVRFAVLYDGTHSASRRIVGQAFATTMEPLADFDSGDGEALLKTVRWAFEQCPAEKYGLVLWSHGSGWRPEEIEKVAQQARGDQNVTGRESADRAAAPGSMSLFRSTLVEILKKPTPPERAICFDDGTGHSLDTLELERITKQISDIIGQPLDFLGMDACLMATLEVAYQLRHSVRYLVASEELVPGTSWPYDAIFGTLRADPARTARDLADLVVRDYVEYYTQHPPALGEGDVTKVALDLSKIDTVAAAADRLAQSLTAEMNNHADVLWQAQFAAVEHETNHKKRKDTKFRFHLWDLASLAEHLSASDRATEPVRQAAAAVTDALKPGGAVIAEGHRGEWFDGIGGVSIYLVPPGGDRRISPYYPEVALAKDTQWDEMLKSYFEVLE